MIASLPMYWWPENALAWTRFWHAVRARLSYLPVLTPPGDLPQDWHAHWGAADLALSQVCGLPYGMRLIDRVTYVGSFDFALPDTPPGHYHSVVLTRPDEKRAFSDLVLAYNSADSQSGWGSTRGRRFAGYRATGSHRASAVAVAEGHADVAFVDAVSWRILGQAQPSITAMLQVLERTPPTPGLVLIAAQGTDPAPLRGALAAALDDLGEADRRAMGGPVGLSVLDPDAYRALPVPAPVPA